MPPKIAQKYEKAIEQALQAGSSMRERECGLVMAAGQGNINAVRTLIEDRRVSPNATLVGDCKRAIHAAVILKQHECVEALLEYGADVTLRDKHGKSALDLATEMAFDLENDTIYNMIREAELQKQGVGQVPWT